MIVARRSKKTYDLAVLDKKKTIIAQIKNVYVNVMKKPLPLKKN